MKRDRNRLYFVEICLIIVVCIHVLSSETRQNYLLVERLLEHLLEHLAMNIHMFYHICLIHEPQFQNEVCPKGIY